MEIRRYPPGRHSKYAYERPEQAEVAAKHEAFVSFYIALARKVNPGADAKYRPCRQPVQKQTEPIIKAAYKKRTDRHEQHQPGPRAADSFMDAVATDHTEYIECSEGYGSNSDDGMTGDDERPRLKHLLTV